MRWVAVPVARVTMAIRWVAVAIARVGMLIVTMSISWVGICRVWVAIRVVVCGVVAVVVGGRWIVVILGWFRIVTVAILWPSSSGIFPCGVLYRYKLGQVCAVLSLRFVLLLAGPGQRAVLRAGLCALSLLHILVVVARVVRLSSGLRFSG